jgi:hypothetical protein
MITKTLPFFLHARHGAAALLLALVPACRGKVEKAAASAGGGSTTGGSSASGGAAPTPTPATASVRFANLSMSLPAFDVCAGGAALLAADGLAGGLGFGQVSRYLPSASSAGAWAMVQPGGSCADPSAVPLSIPWPPGSEHGRVTVVPWPSMTGGAPQTTAYAYLDESQNDHYGIDLRVLEFMGWPSTPGGPSMSVLHQGAGDPMPVMLFWSLTFAAVPTQSSLGAVTPAGFVHTPYSAVGDLTVDANLYIGPMSFPGGVPIPGGQGNAYGIGSIFLAGGFAAGTARAVVCADDSPAVGALSSCTMLVEAP